MTTSTVGQLLSPVKLQCTEVACLPSNAVVCGFLRQGYNAGTLASR
jgi:hypothetical protein